MADNDLDRIVDNLLKPVDIPLYEKRENTEKRLRRLYAALNEVQTRLYSTLFRHAGYETTRKQEMLDEMDEILREYVNRA